MSRARATAAITPALVKRAGIKADDGHHARHRRRRRYGHADVLPVWSALAAPTGIRVVSDRATKRLRALVERPERVRFWGGDYTITPRLITRVYGNGKNLLCITPLATRPNYFVVRIDSSTMDPRDPFPANGETSLIDDIMCAAEEEYGYIDHADEDDKGGFPQAVDWGIGCAWGSPFPVSEWRKS